MDNPSSSVTSKKKKSAAVISPSSAKPTPSEEKKLDEKLNPDAAYPSIQTAGDAETDIPPEKQDGSLPVLEPEINQQKRSVVYWLLSPDTKMGRFMRPFLRGVGVIVGLFALGVLCTYLLLYLPVTKERDEAQKNLLNISQQLETTRSELVNTQSGLKNTQAELAQTNLRANYLQVLVDVTRGRLALANKDGPEAQQVLADLKSSLEKFSPMLKSINPNSASILETRLELINRELVSDPLTAREDLEAFYSKLLELEKVLFK